MTLPCTRGQLFPPLMYLFGPANPPLMYLFGPANPPKSKPKPPAIKKTGKTLERIKLSRSQRRRRARRERAETAAYMALYNSLWVQFRRHHGNARPRIC